MQNQQLLVRLGPESLMQIEKLQAAVLAAGRGQARQGRRKKPESEGQGQSRTGEALSEGTCQPGHPVPGAYTEHRTWFGSKWMSQGL
jgi:hypothetical protein